MSEKNAVEILKKMRDLANELCETRPDVKSMFPKGSKDNVLNLIKDIQREIETLEMVTKSDLKRIQDLGQIFEALKNSDVDYFHHQDLNEDIKSHLIAFCSKVSSYNPNLTVKLVGGYIQRGYSFVIEPTFSKDANLGITFTVKVGQDLEISFNSRGSPYKIPGMMFKSDIVKLDVHFEGSFNILIKSISLEVYQAAQELLSGYNERPVSLNGAEYIGFEFNSRNEANRFIEKYQKIGLEFGVLKVEKDVVTVASLKDLGR